MDRFTNREDSYFHDEGLAAGTAVIKAKGGRVHAFYASNRNAAARYLILFNAASGSADADIVGAFLIPPGDGIMLGDIHLGPQGKPFATGIAFGISTVSTTYDGSATSTEHDVFVRYI